MHKHPTPLSIKTAITEALIMRGKQIDSITMATVYSAIEAGLKKACEEHDKIWGDQNDQ